MNEPIIIHDHEIGYAKALLALPKQYVDYVSSILIPYGVIQDRIEKLATLIHEEYAGKEVIIICILKGAEKFFLDLTKYLDNLNTVSSSSSSIVIMQKEYLKASSYKNDKTTGTVEISGMDISKIKGKHVLLVEDVIDTGTTMQLLTKKLLAEQPLSLKVASLFIKRTNNKFMPDYVGFSIPDVFIVGYCIDYNEHFRDLNHVCIINNLGKEKFRV